ncbi:hypothetical protein J7K86_02770 [bacterium]|nr:hypothetical protein [bacterium]
MTGNINFISPQKIKDNNIQNKNHPGNKKIGWLLFVFALIGLVIGLGLNSLRPNNTIGKVDYNISLQIAHRSFDPSLEIISPGEDLSNLSVSLLPGQKIEKYFYLKVKSPGAWRLFAYLENKKKITDAQLLEDFPSVMLSGSVSATESAIKIKDNSVPLIPNNGNVEIASGGPTNSEGVLIKFLLTISSKSNKSFNELIGDLGFNLVQVQD